MYRTKLPRRHAGTSVRALPESADPAGLGNHPPCQNPLPPAFSGIPQRHIRPSADFPVPWAHAERPSRPYRRSKNPRAAPRATFRSRKPWGAHHPPFQTLQKPAEHDPRLFRLPASPEKSPSAPADAPKHRNFPFPALNQSLTINPALPWPPMNSPVPKPSFGPSPQT